MSVVSVEVKDGIAHVVADNPPVNALGQAVRQGLAEAVAQIDADPSVRAVVLSCAGRTFFAGADIREFDAPPVPPSLPEVIVLIEASRVPWVAAIHGTALGGGCEITLGCHGRVALASAKLGLPEVALGLIPGAGGTVRLPRLVSLEAAMEIATTGKPVSAGRALEIGLVDRVVEEDLLGAAVKFAEELAAKGAPAPLSTLPPREAPDAAAWEAMRAAVQKKARGQNSPVEALDALREGVELPATEALTRERERFLRLKETEQSAALRYLFFAERNTARPAEIAGVEPAPLGHVGVVGGGTMGAGIAASLLLVGISVTLLERDAEAASKARGRVDAVLGGSLKRGLIDAEALSAMQDRLATVEDISALASADLVIEAVFEEMALKKEVFARLEAVVAEEAILATNTSYLNVNEIAAATARPERVLGLHFFTPVHVMKLLEIVRPEKVSPRALATGFALAKRLRKTPVVAGVCDGFIGNRIMSSYRRECEFMLEEGALPQDVDAAMRGFGFPMGLFQMNDVAGLDIGWAMRKRRRAEGNAPPNSAIPDRLCEMGRFGRKTGAGWYRYAEGSEKGEPDPAVEAVILEEAARAGRERRALSADEIMARIIGVMQREGEAILAEGVAQKRSDIDVVMALGYAFPRHRGGPMFMADRS